MRYSELKQQVSSWTRAHKSAACCGPSCSIGVLFCSLSVTTAAMRKRAAAEPVTPQKRSANSPQASAAATEASDAAPTSPLPSPTPPGSPAIASIAAPFAGLTPRRSSKPKVAKPTEGPRALEVTILKYAANGARVNPDFEPQESAYVLILEHPGTKQHPSCLYQFKDNLAAYLQILHNQDPETPSEIIKLVPRLHLLLF